ncbi:MAG: decarboxylating 6-phosphogluconate dehydrogenase [bacterium]|nr:decarboxylating 6-phosphogluconate dehydrogenase [bacterium]
MQLGMIGLGKMGANMVRRIMGAGHECVVFDQTPASVEALENEGAHGTSSLEELVSRLDAPRAIWIMVPAGKITESVVQQLGELLGEGDIVIDGGNSMFKDDVRRAAELAAKGIHYVDCGTSGGVWGIDRGYCLMIGGHADAVAHLDPIFKCLAPGRGDIERTPGRDDGQGTAEEGYLHCGPAGAGHYVKMIHNGIEYGLMQAYAEGFDIMRSAQNENVDERYRFDLDVAEIAEVWRRGSVVGSWLLDLTAQALVEQPELDGYTGHVTDSGEGRWTVNAAVEQAVPADVLTAALYTRFRSRQSHTFAEKVLSAMRHKFGGHVESK